MIHMVFWPYESGTDESGFCLQACITHHTYCFQYCHFPTWMYNLKALHEIQIEVVKQQNKFYTVAIVIIMPPEPSTDESDTHL